MTDRADTSTEAPVEGPFEQVDQAEEAESAADGQVEQPAGVDVGAAADEQWAAAPADPVAEAQQALAERTADLQRLQAEYLNYKRRVERDRELVRENATYAALLPIVDVLDTIDRAREHEPLEGGFKTVAEQLERVVGQLGLTKFGTVGDEFDPTLHEALSHIGTDPDVKVTTCKVIAKAGYKIGDRVVRAAQVLVVDPAEPADATETPEPEAPEPAAAEVGATETETATTED